MTRFVKVEREGYKKTYTTLKVAEHMVASGTATSYVGVTRREIKAEGLREYREEHYFRHVAEDAFRAQYDGKRFKAKVIDGGPRSEMLVSITGAEDLHLQTIYACNIAGKKTWYPETACVFYETGQIVEVELRVFHGFQLFVIGLTQGKLDEEHWERIKDLKLAFRCNEAGEAVTGLGIDLWK